ncbi:c-di-GMP-binding flagellar brake protein YcgR [Sinobacterium caligoides]|uniref:C-di-GMP-binding flagellar brake protein YcgR n=1 Tax=Sinobacterium caligoides TaxID=933926 RepID=A0A3N2DMX5_9GAMM|nr:flagellar brake protein [Sinobacterium caligoides]ROS01163.1 c-di-GMP-binding flagellar brake protein YcgR [Sinobacterium caligoides]
MQFEQLVLDIGTTIDLYVPASADEGAARERRGHSRLVGYVPGEGVMATPPRRGGQRVVLSDGQKMRLRVANEEGEHSFSTQLLSQQKNPLPLVFLSYPCAGVSRLLRRHPRIRLRLPTVVYNSSALDPGQCHVGCLQDISLGGAAVELANASAHVGDQLICHARFRVAGAARQVRLLACVRSRLQQVPSEPLAFDPLRAKAVFGVEFIDSSLDTQLLLQAFVLEQSRCKRMPTVMRPH